MKLASHYVEIGSKISKYLAGMSKVEKRMVEVGQKLTAVGKKMTMGVTLPLLAIGAASIKTAMDAVESENLFEESMKKMAGAARKWSEKLRDELGLNSFETRKTLGTFNVMVKSMGLSEQAAYDMAKGLTQIGYDMASFYNLKPEEAFNKLQSAIAGEAEPLKRLGIIINETTIKTYALNKGIIKQGEKMTETQKVAARYGLIIERTADSQGDMERTLDSPTNKIRILKGRIQELGIEIGMKLLPVFEKLLSHVEKGITWFSGLSESTKETIIKVAGLLAVAGPLSIVLGTIAKTLPLLRAGLIGLTTTPLGLAIIMVAALAAGALTLAENLKEAKKAMSDFADEAAVFATPAEAFKRLWIIVRKEGGETLEQFNELMKRFGGNWDKILKQIIRDPKFASLKALLMDIAGGIKTIDFEGKKLSITLPASFLKIKEAAEETGKKVVSRWQWIADAFHEASVRIGKAREEIGKWESIIPPAAIETTKMSLEDLEEYIKGWTERFYERLETLKEAWLDMFSKMANAVSNFFYQIGAFSQTHYDNQLISIDRNYQAQKEAIEGSTKSEEEKAKALEAIDEKYEKKKRAVQKKAFESRKKISLVTAAINIAEGITMALAKEAPPWNLILAAITAAAGAIQLAAISAQSFPGFAKGGIVKKRMIAEIAEKGPEAVAPLSDLTEIFKKAVKAIFPISLPQMPQMVRSQPAMMPAFAPSGGMAAPSMRGGDDFFLEQRMKRPIHLHQKIIIAGEEVRDEIVKIVEDETKAGGMKIAARSVK